jgi:hypothetical protein
VGGQDSRTVNTVVVAALAYGPLNIAVNNGATGTDGSAQALLDGFHAALVVPLIVAVLGVAVTALGVRRRVVAAEPKLCAQRSATNHRCWLYGAAHVATA